MSSKSLKVIFDKFLNGTSNKAELETLMDSFWEKDNSLLNERIRYELEKEETIDPFFQGLEISNRVFNSLVKKRKKELFTKYLEGQISDKELVELRGYVEVGIINAEPQNTTAINADTHREEQLIARQFLKLRSKKRYSIATSVFLAGIFGLIWIFSDFATTVSHDISLPTHNEATILFDDGELLSVFTSDKDLLFNRGIEIVHLSSNEIAFQIHSNPQIPSKHQRFSSPKGTVSRLILSDGTNIWLNSATKVTYPSSFPETERRIAIDGEAYLEVSKDISKPFIVDADDTQVQVLGTAFNIATNVKKGYVVTTLLHGSIEVATAKQKLIMTPGMQSISDKNKGNIRTHDVSVTDEMAWKSGLFKFNNDDIYTVLDKIKTWYDIEDYEAQNITNDRFSGTVKRTRKLSELLQNLEKISSYKFKIIDRRVIIMK